MFSTFTETITETLMASAGSREQDASTRPNPLRTVRSFPHNEVVDDSEPAVARPQRASTFHNGAANPGSRTQTPTPQKHVALEEVVDAFESGHAGDDQTDPPRASVDMDDLPIELISLTDSFIDSLSHKVHPTPPNIDNLSRLFQDFYNSASSHINTHVASLLTRHSREQSPSARSSPASLLRMKAASIGGKDKAKTSTKTEGEQQMITADELADRKRTRKALEQKRSLLEEAVERRLCEGIYPRIYRHRSTQDEAQDDKLRSKTAALAVVGIGPADLGVELGNATQSPEEMAARQEEVRQWLDQARRDIELMNESRYPLGKLNRLKAAHKSIVETLAHFHPSSSADEIMPMLIYTLITLSPEKLNVISDLNFIHRFRWEPKLVGEAAYCLTNLEAAISFLETVDLATLRPDETPAGPVKSSGGQTSPKAETFPPAYAAGSSAATQDPLDTTTATAGAPKTATTTPSPDATVPSGLRAAVQLRNRRLSDLVNTPAQALGAASDAVFNTADQGLKNITNSLGDSYKFFIGKLREPLGSSGETLVVPKTLDDARKLIGTPPPDDDGSVSGASSVHVPEEPERVGSRVVSREEKMLSLIGGRKVSRDHSADSARSANSSSKKVLFASEDAKAAAAAGGSTPTSTSNPTLFDSARNFGNSLNPMSRLSGIGMMRGFGRTSSIPVVPAKQADGGDLASAFPDIAPALPPKHQPPQISPPVKKFMEAQTAAELRLGDIGDLLRDYRRLAAALKDRDAFKDA
ncbi:hypothetical protein MAPG_01119 [Magnaporthiopsis poae ATCC 64411]|uniref:VPS9 domain-containing protein n=1 Tax=Magnaporthiopsis poae (strain ATCC 64411 / 73-15) TaxID=644358 RepID=A0A0C4DMV4_MAGP6|nr:hypothetical protein MAPG_01119 [Magnaporthiopsis poae ATCC 64411]